MTELSPKARELLELVEDGHEPPVGAHDRVWQAVSSDLASGVNIDAARLVHGTHASGAGTLSLVSKTLWGVGMLVVAGLSAVALVRYQAVKQPAPSTAEPPPHTSERAAELEIAVPANITSETPAPSPTVTAPAMPAAERRSATQHGDQLLREVSALRRAADALTAGRPAQALTLLRAHEKTFANGALTEERDALILVARCTLEPHTGHPAAHAFLARVPNAVLRKRVEKACKLGEEP